MRKITSNQNKQIESYKLTRMTMISLLHLISGKRTDGISNNNWQVAQSAWCVLDVVLLLMFSICRCGRFVCVVVLWVLLPPFRSRFDGHRRDFVPRGSTDISNDWIGKKWRNEHRGGASDATTSKSLIVSLFMMSFTNSSTSKQLVTSFKITWDERIDGHDRVFTYRL